LELKYSIVMITLKDSYLYNQKLTKDYAKTFYLSLAFLNNQKRQDIYAVYGFCRFSDNLVDDEPDKKEAEKNLNLWRTELQAGIDQGDSEDIVLKSFIFVLKKYNIDSKLAFDLLEGMEMDLKQSRFDTYDELLNYCYLVASVPGLLVLNILGYTDKEKAVKYGAELGKAMQLTNILRDLKEDFERDRIYLPKQDLQKYGVSDKDFGLPIPTENLRLLIADYATKANQFYQESNKGIEYLTKDSRFVVKTANKLYSAILLKIQQKNYDVFSKRISLSFWEKLMKIFF
jgi:15-cis-phytoene synthase